MEQDSEKTLTKYCLDCKTGFQDHEITCKVAEAEPGASEIINYCPACGSENMFYLKGI